jgi:hypothetical protein
VVGDNLIMLDKRTDSGHHHGTAQPDASVEGLPPTDVPPVSDTDEDLSF